MKRGCRKCDKCVFSEDMVIEILHRLPSKSLARFKCVCTRWRKYIADSSQWYSCRSLRWGRQPSLIGFFYQAPELKIPMRSETRFFFSLSKEEKSYDGSLDPKSLVDNFLDGRDVYIVASSNGFLLCYMRQRRMNCYYVYNPATRQCLALPKTQIYMKDRPLIGFICKDVDDPDKDVISFTIVRYAVPPISEFQSSVNVESFSSETNMWTAHCLILDQPLVLFNSTIMKSPSACVVDGVFVWLNNARQITLYDRVYNRFWAWQLPEHMLWGGNYFLDISGGALYYSFLGMSGGALYYVLNDYFKAVITVWCLESNIRSSQDAVVWVKKYVADVATTLRLQCPEAFACPPDHIKLLNMAIHPAVPKMFYLVARSRVISYDIEKDIAQIVHEFRVSYEGAGRYKLFPYEWHQWPRTIK